MIKTNRKTRFLDRLVKESSLSFDSFEQLCAARWVSGQGLMLNGLFHTNRMIARAYNEAQLAAGNPIRATLYW